MDAFDTRERLLSFSQVSEETPFGDGVLVYKIAGKVFALLIPEEFPARMNLKCNPDRAVELRGEHEAIIPGYHMNKKHWNTILLDGSLPENLIIELIEHSFNLVVEGLPKVKREQLKVEN